MRRSFSRGLVLAVMGAAIVTGPLAAQRDFSNVQVEAVHVAGGVYMLTGAGGNIGLSVGEDGPFIVDDQFAPLTERILAAIATVTEGSVRFVLNTHWHGDHTGGNENLGKAGAMIVAHENVRKRLNPAEFQEEMERSQQSPPDALPVVTFTDAVSFYWNDEKIKAFHVEHAHTDGDAVIHFADANVFHMGDTFFNGRFPFIDIGSGGSINGLIHAADRVLGMSNSETQIIPGHGPLAKPGDLRSYRDMLIALRDRIRTMINDGMSIDQIAAADPTSDLPGTWQGNAERTVRAAAQNLGAR